MKIIFDFLLFTFLLCSLVYKCKHDFLRNSIYINIYIASTTLLVNVFNYILFSN